MHPAQSTGDARRAADARDRVTIDLRGLGPQLRLQATKRHMTAAALLRHAFTAMLDEESHTTEDDKPLDPLERGQAKVTVRMAAHHAETLVRRARSADVSQGRYVASLLDGTPTEPLAHDHGRAVAALLASTDRLAVLSADLNAFMRLVGRVPSGQLEAYRASIHGLGQDVRAHLAASAALVALLRPPKGRR